MRVTVAGNAAEAEAGGQNARALEDALVDAVADLDTKAADLADGGETVGEAVVGLLDGDGLLLEERLHDPVGVIVGQVAREVQVGVDQAGKDGLAGGVDNLNALGKVLHGTGAYSILPLSSTRTREFSTGSAPVPSMSLPPTIAYLVDMVPPYGSI